MRIPKFLSPSAVALWQKDKEQYFIKYLAENRPPSVKQTGPMAVGSAFDAYIKSYLYKRFIGVGNEKFQFDTLFEKQVDLHNRDEAKAAGEDCFDQYKHSGALNDIILLIQKSDEEPKMEFTSESTIGDAENPVNILGIPDLFLRIKGKGVTLDWKVNGYYSKSAISPVPGYKKCTDGWRIEHGPTSRSHGKSHKDYEPYFENGIEYNMIPYLEQKKPEWAQQLCIYSWLAGANIDEEIVICIHQLACAPKGNKKLIRVAQHYCEITPAFQRAVYKNFQELWDILHSGHIFQELTQEQSALRCKILNEQAAAFIGETTFDEWFRNMYGR